MMKKMIGLRWEIEDQGSTPEVVTTRKQELFNQRKELLSNIPSKQF